MDVNNASLELQVECPFCRQKPGNPCVHPPGRENAGTHKLRIRVAMTQLMQHEEFILNEYED